MAALAVVSPASDRRWQIGKPRSFGRVEEYRMRQLPSREHYYRPRRARKLRRQALLLQDCRTACDAMGSLLFIPALIYAGLWALLPRFLPMYGCEGWVVLAVLGPPLAVPLLGIALALEAGRVRCQNAAEVLEKEHRTAFGALPPVPRNSFPPFLPLGWRMVGAVLSLSVAICMPRFHERSKEANGLAAKTQMFVFSAALSIYRVDNGQVPSTPQGLRALLAPPSSSPRPRNWKGPYLNDVSEIPRDPWGNDYHYEAPGPHGEPFYILSYGEDGRPGGEFWAADVDSNPK